MPFLLVVGNFTGSPTAAGFKTIAFPCLGMGVYQVPLDIGAKTSIDKAIKYAENFEKIYLVCFKEEEYEYYCEYLKEKQKDC